MNLKNPKTIAPKSLFVKVLQWFYLITGILTATFFLWSKQISFFSSPNIPGELILAITVAAGLYCLILSLSFFAQNTNLLILSLVLIFFTTISALIMLVVTIPNAQTIFSGNLPECSRNLALCNLKDGVIVASAMFMAISIPLLILNFITIIGAVIAIAATD